MLLLIIVVLWDKNSINSTPSESQKIIAITFPAGWVLNFLEDGEWESLHRLLFRVWVTMVYPRFTSSDCMDQKAFKRGPGSCRFSNKYLYCPVFDVLSAFLEPILNWPFLCPAFRREYVALFLLRFYTLLPVTAPSHAGSPSLNTRLSCTFRHLWHMLGDLIEGLKTPSPLELFAPKFYFVIGSFAILKYCIYLYFGSSAKEVLPSFSSFTTPKAHSTSPWMPFMSF